MRYYKTIDSGYISAIGTGGGGTEITETEYNAIMTAIQSKPPRTEDTDYHLTEQLEWVAYERIEPVPEDEEVDDAEALRIITGVTE